MTSKDRLFTYFKSGFVGAIGVPVILVMLFALSGIWMKFFPASKPLLGICLLHASRPVFLFGNMVNARLGGLMILGILYWVLVGMIAGPISVWLYLRLFRKEGRRPRDRLVVALVLGAIVTSVIVLNATSDRRVFRRYVAKPVPKSVKGIKTHHPWEGSGHRYVMHFRISKADAERIISSRPFRRAECVKYSNGRLEWGDVPPFEKPKWGYDLNRAWEEPWQSENMVLYSPGVGEPGPVWFRPDRWDNPRVYAFKETTASDRGHRQIFIFYEELSEAYFVEYLSGTW